MQKNFFFIALSMSLLTATSSKAVNHCNIESAPKEERYQEPELSLKQFLPEKSDDSYYVDVSLEIIEAANNNENIKVPSKGYSILKKMALDTRDQALKHARQKQVDENLLDHIFIKIESQNKVVDEKGNVEVTEKEIASLLPYLARGNEVLECGLFKFNGTWVENHKLECILQIMECYENYADLLKKGRIRCSGKENSELYYRPRNFTIPYCSGPEYSQKEYPFEKKYGPRFRMTTPTTATFDAYCKNMKLVRFYDFEKDSDQDKSTNKQALIAQRKLMGESLGKLLNSLRIENDPEAPISQLLIKKVNTELEKLNEPIETYLHKHKILQIFLKHFSHSDIFLCSDSINIETLIEKVMRIIDSKEMDEDDNNQGKEEISDTLPDAKIETLITKILHAIDSEEMDEDDSNQGKEEISDTLPDEKALITKILDKIKEENKSLIEANKKCKLCSKPNAQYLSCPNSPFFRSHYFHKACLDAWSSKNNECPACM